MNEIKLGFIGYGRHANNNLYPALKLLGQPIQAIATTSKESSERGMQEQGAENAYADYEEMLEKEDLNCVIISAPGEKHVELTEAALEAGCHVFVEKPLGLNADEAEQVMSKAEATGKHVMVGFMKRFAPAFVRMHELIKDQRFGDLVTVNCVYGVRNFSESIEDVILFAAIHNINMLQSITGEPVKLVGFKRALGDSLTATFSYQVESGITASMSIVAAPSWARLHEEFYVTGTNGFIRVNNVEQLSYHFNPDMSDRPRWQVMDEEETIVTTVSTTSSGGYKDLYQRGFVGELEHFLDCVRTDVKPLTSAEDNLATMKLSDMIISECK